MIKNLRLLPNKRFRKKKRKKERKDFLTRKQKKEFMRGHKILGFYNLSLAIFNRKKKNQRVECDDLKKKKKKQIK